jgi:ribosomal protein L37AE/L43A
MSPLLPDCDLDPPCSDPVRYEPDEDFELTQRWERIDAGTECPACWQRIEARSFAALGLALWQCPQCKAYWVKP